VRRVTSRLWVAAAEYDFDIGSGFAGGSHTVRCLWPVTNVYQSNIRGVEARSCKGDWIILCGIDCSGVFF
jgi:hypothetical protein